MTTSFDLSCLLASVFSDTLLEKAMMALWMVAALLTLLLFVAMAVEPWLFRDPPDETATTPPSGSTTSDSCCSSPKNPGAFVGGQSVGNELEWKDRDPAPARPDASPFHTPDSAFLVPSSSAACPTSEPAESHLSPAPAPVRGELGVNREQLEQLIELAERANRFGDPGRPALQTALPGRWLWSATRSAFVWLPDAPILPPSSEPPPAQPALQTKPAPAEFHTLVVDPRPPADWSGYPYSNPPTPPL